MLTAKRLINVYLRLLQIVRLPTVLQHARARDVARDEEEDTTGTVRLSLPGMVKREQRGAESYRGHALHRPGAEAADRRRDAQQVDRRKNTLSIRDLIEMSTASEPVGFSCNF